MCLCFHCINGIWSGIGTTVWKHGSSGDWYINSPSCAGRMRGSCDHRAAVLCLTCSCIQSPLVLWFGSGGVRLESLRLRISWSSSISGVTRLLTYTFLYCPWMSMPWITQVSCADRKQIFCDSSTFALISGSSPSWGSTQMRSIRSLGIRQAKGVFCLKAALACRQILSAGGAHMPKVYLSLGILLEDIES